MQKALKRGQWGIQGVQSGTCKKVQVSVGTWSGEAMSSLQVWRAILLPHIRKGSSEHHMGGLRIALGFSEETEFKVSLRGPGTGCIWD